MANCCICTGEIDKHYTKEGVMYWDKGHNPEPIEVNAAGEPIDTEGGGYRCCSGCNDTVVFDARLKNLLENK